MMPHSVVRMLKLKPMQAPIAITCLDESGKQKVIAVIGCTVVKHHCDPLRGVAEFRPGAAARPAGVFVCYTVMRAMSN
jgi:hypothetical protein